MELTSKSDTEVLSQARSDVAGWRGYVLDNYDFAEFQAADIVLDVGCGDGRVLEELGRKECRPIGIDVNWECLTNSRAHKVPLLQSEAEFIPLRGSSVDGVVCKVVIPYVHEQRALQEIARVLKPGGLARLCYHGAGYYLRYLLCDRSWKVRFYGLRTLVNSWCYAFSGRRLPGFMGDTLFQSRRRLTKYYDGNSLKLQQEYLSPSFLGFPVFIYHSLVKARLSNDSATTREGVSRNTKGVVTVIPDKHFETCSSLLTRT